MNIRREVPLSSLTTLGVGGPAAYICEARTVGEISDACTAARAEHLPLLVLGGGSNILVADSGVRAVILKCSMDAQLRFTGGLLTVSAGTRWDDVVAYATEHALAGIECMSGIPGSAGAACVQNIGAYGQEIGSAVAHVDAMDLTTGRRVRIGASECRFGYRTSIFNGTARDRYVITGISLRLMPGGQPTVTYPDVKSAVTPGASLADVRSAVIAIRKGKGMLEGIHRSAGSFFKNPIITHAPPPGVRAWPFVDGRHKVSAASLIEESGFARGHRHGTAGISPDHALSLIAHPGGTATDIIGLARSIQERVVSRHGILLEPEVQLWGFDEYPLMR